MKLPNGTRAIVDIQKLEAYCLNPNHPRGRNKARVFASLGLGRAEAGILRDALLTAAVSGDARPGAPTPYGHRYVVDFELVLPGKTARIRSAWIVRLTEDVPRLTSCYVL